MSRKNKSNKSKINWNATRQNKPAFIYGGNLGGKTKALIDDFFKKYCKNIGCPESILRGEFFGGRKSIFSDSPEFNPEYLNNFRWIAYMDRMKKAWLKGDGGVKGCIVNNNNKASDCEEDEESENFAYTEYSLLNEREALIKENKKLKESLAKNHTTLRSVRFYSTDFTQVGGLTDHQVIAQLRDNLKRIRDSLELK